MNDVKLKCRSAAFLFFSSLSPKEFRPQTRKWELRLSTAAFESDSVEISFVWLSRCKFTTNFYHKTQVLSTIHSPFIQTDRKLNYAIAVPIKWPHLLFTGIKVCQHIANRLLYSVPPYFLLWWSHVWACGIRWSCSYDKSTIATSRVRKALLKKWRADAV